MLFEVEIRKENREGALLTRRYVEAVGVGADEAVLEGARKWVTDEALERAFGTIHIIVRATFRRPRVPADGEVPDVA